VNSLRSAIPVIRRSLGAGGMIVVLSMWSNAVAAAPNDWAEGTEERSDGATRDFYNRAGLFRWDNFLGDWRDADDRSQGDRPYATAVIEVDRRPKTIEWDVTMLVREWLDGTHPNQGFFLRNVSGEGSFHFRSREFGEADKRPVLVISRNADSRTLSPVADTYLEPSTYRSMGHAETLRVSGRKNNKNHALLRFDLDELPRNSPVVKAVLRLHCFAQFGNRSTIGIYRCSQGHDEPPSEPVLGLAARYPDDRGIAGDPDVLFFADFESDDWQRAWTQAAGQVDVVAADPRRRFEPLRGQGLRVRIGEGTHTALNFTWKFQRETGAEPEEVYFRYYLRLGDDWNQTIQGGKMPGLSGTYGTAGWGGRKSDGTNGWSARGAFHPSIPVGNPLAGTHPIGTYCYHADMPGTYGETWLWQRDYRGFLATNRWYSVEQYVKLNTPGEKDGVLRAWIDGRPAFEKNDLQFRHTPRLRIEQVWMNVYHGGREPSPHDQHLYIDNVVIARKYVGPLQPAADGE
jgi:hypothetical protein